MRPGARSQRRKREFRAASFGGVTSEISALAGVTEAVAVAGASVPEEAPEEGECRFLAPLHGLARASVLAAAGWRALGFPAF